MEEAVTLDGFDYIICGGGLAGCVLAERLSFRNGRKRILLLEAGGANYNHILLRIPLGILRLIRSKFDWQYETSGEKFCHGRNIYLQRGKVCM
jgi:choline dehydrogenase